MIRPEIHNLPSYLYRGNKPVDNDDDLDLYTPPEPPDATPPDSEPETPPASGGSDILGDENKTLLVKTSPTQTPPPPATGGSRSAGNNNGYTTETFTNEDGAVTVTTYDASGNIIKEVTTQPDGDVYTFEFEYDSEGRLVKQTDIVNGKVENVHTTTYNGNSQVVVTTDGDGNTVASTEYADNIGDAQGDYSTPEVSGEDKFNSFIYDDKGKMNPTYYNTVDAYKELFPESEGYKVVKQDNTYVIYKDNELYLKVAKDHKGNLSYNYYNEDGSWTEIAFKLTDDTNRIFEFQGAIKHNGNNSTYMDVYGNEICTIDKNQYPDVKVTYDSLTGKIQKIVAESDSEKIIYNQNGKPVEYHDKKKHTVTYYDANGKKERVEDNIKHTTTYYDKNGNVKELHDEVNNSVTKYDNKGNKTSVHYKDFDVTMLYDKEGNVTSSKGDITKVYQKIIDEIYKTNGLGIAITAEGLEELIENFIYEGNLEEFLAYYKKNSPDNADFLDDLANELGLSSFQKDRIRKHLEKIQKSIEEGKKSPTNTPETPENGDTAGENGGTNPSGGETGGAGNGGNAGTTGDGGNTGDDTTIDGGELPEVTVEGEAGEGVTMHDGYAFKLITNADGTVCYQVCSPEGDFYYVSTEAYETFVKNSKLYDVEDFLKENAVTNPWEVPEEPELYNWTEPEKNSIRQNLMKTFGIKNRYNISFNVDGSISFTVQDRNGNTIYSANDIDPKKPMTKPSTFLKEDIPNYALTLPDYVIADAQLSACLSWMYDTFVDEYGNFDGKSFSNWVNKNYGQGSAYYYENKDAVYAYEALLRAASSDNWNEFWANLENYYFNDNLSCNTGVGYYEGGSYTIYGGRGSNAHEMNAYIFISYFHSKKYTQACDS